jgi:hypothetical protein
MNAHTNLNDTVASSITPCGFNIRYRVERCFFLLCHDEELRKGQRQDCKEFTISKI